MKHILKPIGFSHYVRERETGKFDFTDNVNEAKVYLNKAAAQREAMILSMAPMNPGLSYEAVELQGEIDMGRARTAIGGGINWLAQLDKALNVNAGITLN